MPEEAPGPKKVMETHVTADEAPRARRPARMSEWRLDVFLALLGLGIAVAFVARRPLLALFVVAFFLISYALVRLWHRHDEHPDRGRRFRRV